MGEHNLIFILEYFSAVTLLWYNETRSVSRHGPTFHQTFQVTDSHLQSLLDQKNKHAIPPPDSKPHLLNFPKQIRA